MAVYGNGNFSRSPAKLLSVFSNELLPCAETAMPYICTSQARVNYRQKNWRIHTANAPTIRFGFCILMLAKNLHS